MGQIVLCVKYFEKLWDYFHTKKRWSYQMFAQNVIWLFQILKGRYVILPKPINQKENLNAIHVVLEIREYQMESRFYYLMPINKLQIKNVEKLLGLRSDSNFKDKINIISLILGLIFGLLYVMSYLIGNLGGAQVLVYTLGLCFLVWFATRRNGCGSCNQVSN